MLSFNSTRVERIREIREIRKAHGVSCRIGTMATGKGRGGGQRREKSGEIRQERKIHKSVAATVAATKRTNQPVRVHTLLGLRN